MRGFCASYAVPWHYEAALQGGRGAARGLLVTQRNRKDGGGRDTDGFLDVGYHLRVNNLTVR